MLCASVTLKILAARNHTLATLNDGGCDCKCEPQQGGEETEDLQHQVKILILLLLFDKKD